MATLSAEGIEPVKFTLFVNDDIFLCRDDSAALSSIRVENGSAFPGAGNYGASCRVWLKVSFNETIGQ